MPPAAPSAGPLPPFYPTDGIPVDAFLLNHLFDPTQSYTWTAPQTFMQPVGFGTPPINNATVSILPNPGDFTMLGLQAQPGNNIDFISCYDDNGFVLFNVRHDGRVDITPQQVGATGLHVQLPFSNSGAALFEFFQSGSPIQFAIYDGGGPSTFVMNGGSVGNRTLQLFAFSAAQTAPILAVTVPGGITAAPDRLIINANGLQANGLGDATTNTLSDAVVLDHQTTGVAAAGWGHSIHMTGESSTTTGRDMARLDALWATATDASRKSRVVLSAFDTTVREGLRVEATGTAAAMGVLGAPASPRINVTGSRGGNAALASLITAMATFGWITDGSSA